MRALVVLGAVAGAAALGLRALTGSWPTPATLRRDLGPELERVKGALREALEAGKRAAGEREREFERELAAAG